MSLAQETKETGAKSPWSFRLLTVSGIPIRIHFTFLLFLVWIALYSREELMWVGLILAVFACVLLHELGHAFMARRFGVHTRDITLYPIGGVAMLDGRPSPRAEFWIALAGPAVNVVIAAVLAVVLKLTDGRIPTFGGTEMAASFLTALFAANISLVLFNLVTAFPMDGGRVLRSLLAMRMDETKATQIAAAIGQALAMAFGVFALFRQEPIWMLVAFFVFLGAGQEASQSLTRSFLFGHAIQDAMQSRFRTIGHGETMSTAAEMLLAGSQHDFPVMAGEEIAGVLTRHDIAQGLATEGPTAYVAKHMRREFKTAHRNVPLEMAIDMFTQDDPTPILVMDDGQLVGMITQENLSEFIMLEHARRQARGHYA